MDSNKTYTSAVPENYKSVNISVGFGSEFTGAIVTPDGNRTPIRSGERKTVNLNEGGTGSTTSITIEIAGPANGGDYDKFTLNIVKN
jgi:hypothetical protein